jgi:insulin-like growth factor 2 mRNA-binding protein 1
MLPLLVMELFKDIPGLSGIFISGVFAAALSSLSTGLNSMSAVVLEDFVKAFRKERLSNRMSTLITRSTVLLLGIISFALVFLVQKMGTILQLTLSLPTACFGPLFGVYIIGFFLPWINKKATLIGSIIGFLTMMSYVIMVQFEIARGKLQFATKPLSTEGCDYTFTAANNTQSLPAEVSGFSQIYQISYLYYTLIGTVLVLLLSTLMSLILGFEDINNIDRRLLAPFIAKRFMRKTKETSMATIENHASQKQTFE